MHVESSPRFKDEIFFRTKEPRNIISKIHGAGWVVLPPSLRISSLLFTRKEMMANTAKYEHLLSKAVRSFTHETQVLIKSVEGRCRQLLLYSRFMEGVNVFFVHTHRCCCVEIILVFRKSHVVTASL